MDGRRAVGRHVLLRHGAARPGRQRPQAVEGEAHEAPAKHEVAGQDEQRPHEEARGAGQLVGLHAAREDHGAEAQHAGLVDGPPEEHREREDGRGHARPRREAGPPRAARACRARARAEERPPQKGEGEEDRELARQVEGTDQDRPVGRVGRGDRDAHEGCRDRERRHPEVAPARRERPPHARTSRASSPAVCASVRAPCSRRNRSSLKPQVTMMQSHPAFLAVSTSTSESPT